MVNVKYLGMDEVVAIHEEMITRFGGRLPIHDFSLLHSAISRPKAIFGGEDLYPTIFEKAAALISSLILNNPFDDGNKRTAITACSRFLFINGWELRLPKKESVRLTLDIDAKRINLEKIAFWLKKRSQKVK